MSDDTPKPKKTKVARADDNNSDSDIDSPKPKKAKKAIYRRYKFSKEKGYIDAALVEFEDLNIPYTYGNNTLSSRIITLNQKSQFESDMPDNKHYIYSDDFYIFTCINNDDEEEYYEEEAVFDIKTLRDIATGFLPYVYAKYRDKFSILIEHFLITQNDECTSYFLWRNTFVEMEAQPILPDVYDQNIAAYIQLRVKSVLRLLSILVEDCMPVNLIVIKGAPHIVEHCAERYVHPHWIKKYPLWVGNNIYAERLRVDKKSKKFEYFRQVGEFYNKIGLLAAAVRQFIYQWPQIIRKYKLADKKVLNHIREFLSWPTKLPIIEESEVTG